MLWLVLLVITLGFAYRWYKIRRILQVARQIKCDIKAYPLLGHAYLFIGDGESKRMRTFERLGREAIKNGGLTNMWLGDNYFIPVVVDPVDLEVILKSSLEKDDVMRFPRNLVGGGTILAPGKLLQILSQVSLWRLRRKVLAPTFSPKNLNNFVRIFSRQSSVLAEQLQTEADSGPFSVWKYLTSYTMDSVCVTDYYFRSSETALGVNVNAQKTEDEPFLKAFEKCCILIAERMVQPWLHPDAVYKLLPYHEAFESSKKLIYDFIEKVQIVKSQRITIKENKDGVNKSK
uniref:SFRICE006802.2 n=1 Tax=Spodoptera frugiperda TaxID=7108 RepID=A0A2H1WBJ1_SPOFR